MRCTVLAVIAALAPAGAGVAGAAVDLNAAIEARIQRADSVRVVRLRETLSGEICLPGGDRLDDFIVEREGRADGAWRAAMLKVLSEAMRRFPSPTVCPRSSGLRRIRFGVQFFHGEKRTTFIFYLAERCFEFWTGRSFEGSAKTGDFGPRILSLLKQAFPTDTTVRHLDLAGLISCDDYLREHPAGVPVEQLPEATRRVPPKYPKEAKKAKTEGQVLVQATIGADGTVGEVRILMSVPGLDAAAVAAVRQWRFEPALDCWGRSVACPIVIPVRFALE